MKIATARLAVTAALTAALLCLGAAIPLAAQPDFGSPYTSITVNGSVRYYVIDLPRVQSTGPMPLVLVFHGGGGSPVQIRAKTGFSSVAGAAGAIVVYPEGSWAPANSRHILTWNAGTCCGFAQRRNIDDVAFIRALLDTLEAKYRVDRHRIFATGLSNGGMMTYLAGCRLSDRFAAIAVVSGELTEPCNPARPVSVLIIHGTADENLPYNGGIGPRALDRHEVRPVSYAVDSWRQADRCTSSSAITKNGAVTVTAWLNCADSTAVELYTIQGGGHAWPGAQPTARSLNEPGEPNDALDATRVVWSFFVAHARQ